MSRRFINQLHENLRVAEIYQMTERTLRTNKHGDLYLQFVLTDKTGSIDARLWNAEENVLSKFENGSFVSVDGVVQRFQGTLQFIAKTITPVAAEKLDPADFARGGVVDVARLTVRVKELLAELKNPDLRNLADCFITVGAVLLCIWVLRDERKSRLDRREASRRRWEQSREAAKADAALAEQTRREFDKNDDLSDR